MEKYETQILAEGKYLRYQQIDGWECVKRVGCSDIIVLIALTNENRLLLVEQLRRPVKNRVLELPAGLVGDTDEFKNEEPRTAAHRELYEETGYEAEEFTLLTEGPLSPGLSCESVKFYYADKIKKTGPGGGDENEEIKVHEAPLENIHQWIKDKRREGLLIDPKIFIGIYFALSHKEKM